MSEKRKIVLSLISHTNIGKTTLARTLLRSEVGVVRDEAHVTDESTEYVMLETPNEVLVLWDTPGFGNVNQLLKRIQAEGGAWGWLMHEVVDRVFNRSLYSSLEATRNVKSQSDVVLYLVNVKEHPMDAGYVAMELKLLESIGKPVIMILNQVSEAILANAGERKRLEALWLAHFSNFSCLKSILVLDAFTRSWHQELKLITSLLPHVSNEARASLERISDFYRQKQSAIFDKCATFACEVLYEARIQELDPSPDKNPKVLFQELVSELQSRIDSYLEVLIEAHGIETEGRARFKADLQQVTGQTATKLDEKKSGLLAGALSSASTGLMADVFSGGLTFGGGAIIGFLGGFFGGLTYAKMMNLRKRGHMSWRHETLIDLFQLLIVYYLVALHHGRGKGKWNLDTSLGFISEKTFEVWQPHKNQLKSILDQFDKTSASAKAPFLRDAKDVFQSTVYSVLKALYPDLPVIK